MGRFDSKVVIKLRVLLSLVMICFADSERYYRYCLNQFFELDIPILPNEDIIRLNNVIKNIQFHYARYQYS